jgi:hypothetical protein
MTKNELVTIRDYKKEDQNFIYSTWLKGLYYGEFWFSLIPKDIFMSEYHKVIDKIFNTSGCSVKVACLVEDPEVILGYSVLSSSGALHWVFVKKIWRNIGVAKSLVPKNTKYATTTTLVGLKIMKKKNIQLNPFLI